VVIDKSGKYRLLVLTPHPVQYLSPWLRRLAKVASLDLDVVYLRELNSHSQGVGFGQAFTWDLPLREGYESCVLNVSGRLHSLVYDLAVVGQAIRTRKPNAVLVTGWNEPLLAFAIPLARALGARLLVRGESNELRQRTWKARLLHRCLLKFVSAVLVIGSSNKDFYSRCAFPAERTFSGAYFVENERFLQMSAENQIRSDELRVKDGASADEVVFVFSGKHVPFKRPDWIVEAAGKLVSEGLSPVLRFAGSGEMTEMLKLRCSDLGVRAHFVGFLNQTELWRAYVGGDVFVLPSTTRETWGLVVNEAMLFGLPVIVSAEVGCAQDLVVEGKTGWVFQGGIAGLADSMRRAIIMRARLQEMRQHAVRHVSANFSMDIATDGLLNAIASLRR
jgi:glycosyltransferase involved in cell wall biosynthesis